jgi:hypothetical protein
MDAVSAPKPPIFQIIALTKTPRHGEGFTLEELPFAALCLCASFLKLVLGKLSLKKQNAA